MKTGNPLKLSVITLSFLESSDILDRSFQTVQGLEAGKGKGGSIGGVEKLKCVHDSSLMQLHKDFSTFLIKAKARRRNLLVLIRLQIVRGALTIATEKEPENMQKKLNGQLTYDRS